MKPNANALDVATIQTVSDSDFRARTPIEEDPREALSPTPDIKSSASSEQKSEPSMDRVTTPESNLSEKSQPATTQPIESQSSRSATPQPSTSEGSESITPQTTAPESPPPPQQENQTEINATEIPPKAETSANETKKEQHKPSDENTLRAPITAPTTEKGKSKITGKTITGWI